MNRPVFLAATDEGSVLVVEDSDGERNEIVDCLSQHGFRAVGTANMGEFEFELHRNKYEAASIDWELNERMVGPELIKAAREAQSHVGCVVLTKHDVVTSKNSRAYADRFMRKPVGGLASKVDEYISDVRHVVHLGTLRRLAHTLGHRDGVSRFPSIQPGQDLDSSDEETIRSKCILNAVDWMLRDTVNTEDRPAFFDDLERCGWWPRVATDRYAQAPWAVKLCALLEWTKLDNSTVSSVLEIADADVIDCLNDDNISGRLIELYEAPLFGLFGVLSYFLELSEYQTTMMPVYWTHRYKAWHARQLPPWGDVGIGPYLIAGKLKGIETAITWIQS